MRTATDLVGRRIDHYEVLSYITSGGMAIVYRARDPRTQQMVALKILPTELATDANYKARFEREARTAEGLRHPHIVPVYDHGADGELSYVVMQLLEGGTLTQRLQARKATAQPLPSLGETADLLRQVGSALDFAHSQQVIHRDVKPGNMMFDTAGKAFILDFGIAKLVSAATTDSHTESGVPIGTPWYMAPEQWRGDDPTPAVDQYAMGVVAYRLVTGVPPFRGDSPYALMQKHRTAPLPPIDNYPRLLAEALHAVLAVATAKDAAARYPSLSAFAEAFADVVATAAGPSTHFFTFALPLPDATLNPSGDVLPEAAPQRADAATPRNRFSPRRILAILSATVVLTVLCGLLWLGAALLLVGLGDDDTRSTPNSVSGRTLSLRYNGPTLVLYNNTDATFDLRGLRFETGAANAYFDAEALPNQRLASFAPGLCLVLSLAEVAPALPGYCADDSPAPRLWENGTTPGLYFVWDREITGVQQFQVTLQDGQTLGECRLVAQSCRVPVPGERVRLQAGAAGG